MATLLLDIGNSRTKAAIASSGQLKILRQPLPATPELFDTWRKKHQLTHLFISNVNASNHSALITYSKHLKVLSNNHKLKLPFINKYKSKTLGQDRIALVAAASSLYKSKNVLIISCGTCITYDILNNKQEYLGGAISPGLYMRFKSLNEYTAQLPLITSYKAEAFIGNTTEQSIQSGVIHGILGEIEFQIKYYKKNFTSLKIILSGGDARYFEPHLNYKIFAHDNFVLQGLYRILQLNYPQFA